MASQRNFFEEDPDDIPEEQKNNISYRDGLDPESRLQDISKEYGDLNLQDVLHRIEELGQKMREKLKEKIEKSERYVSDTICSKEKLFQWLFYPYNLENENDTIMAIIKFGEEYNIPDNILLRKIIQYLTQSTSNKEDIINILIDKKIMGNYNLDALQNIIDDAIKLQYNEDIETNRYSVKQLSIMYDYDKYEPNNEPNNKFNKNTIHSGYPLPDEEKGRPLIAWKECYYPKCHKKFNLEDQLITHLKLNNAYRHGFHKFHEEAVHKYNLTPEKVLKDHIVHCPCIVCDKGANYKFTPEGLCEHFKLLGIVPFWKPNSTFNIDDTGLLKKDIYRQIYIHDDCLICMSGKKSNVLFYPCYHCVSCLMCHSKLDICPICRQNIKYRFPF